MYWALRNSFDFRLLLLTVILFHYVSQENVYTLLQLLWMRQSHSVFVQVQQYGAIEVLRTEKSGSLVLHCQCPCVWIVCCPSRPILRIHICQVRTWVNSVQSATPLNTPLVEKLFFVAPCHPAVTSSSLQPLIPINRENSSSGCWQSRAAVHCESLMDRFGCFHATEVDKSQPPSNFVF